MRGEIMQIFISPLQKLLQQPRQYCLPALKETERCIGQLSISFSKAGNMKMQVCMRWVVCSLVVVLLCLEQVKGVQAADPAHRVESLPGQPTVRFSQYAGYVTVNKEKGRALFYWLVQANHKKASTMPISFWFNGGPGCSSIGAGAMSELGPFFNKNEGSGLVPNKHAWNKASNIVFVDSPAGVGYSYSNTSSDYNYLDDDLTAVDALAFMVGWFTKFPEYQKNDVYLLGESYAGHYAPNLAQKILLHNEKTSGKLNINLKGFLIGNPWTDSYYDNKGAVDFWYHHSLISDETYNEIQKSCDYRVEPAVGFSTSAACRNAANHASNLEMAEIDAYNIYAGNCNSASIVNDSTRSIKTRPSFFLGLKDSNFCGPDTTTPYLNLPEVKAALHARPGINWTECSLIINSQYSVTSVVQSMLPVYRYLLTKGLKIWIYSGDIDGVVPTTGTRYWLRELDLTVEVPWYPWNHSTQVGGWTQVYKGLTFVTVRDAGHMVPADKPSQALQVFRRFLAGKPLPSF